MVEWNFLLFFLSYSSRDDVGIWFILTFVICHRLFFTEIFKKTIQKHGLSGGVISLSEEYSFKESRMAARSRNTCSTYAIRKLKRLSITILSFAFCYIGIGLLGTMQDSYLKPMFSWLQEILDQCISYISYKVDWLNIDHKNFLWKIDPLQMEHRVELVSLLVG
ncbi:hypothetical protein Lser_V15G31987 [Lactuca serriola]